MGQVLIYYKCARKENSFYDPIVEIYVAAALHKLLFICMFCLLHQLFNDVIKACIKCKCDTSCTCM